MVPVPMRSRMIGFALTFAAAAGALCGARATDAGGRGVTIFYTAEVHGTPEPCGCTSDPLGDVARYASVVREAARASAVLMVDGGGLSFPETSTPKEKGA